MHNKQVTANIENFMEQTTQRILDNEEYPLLLLSNKEIGGGKQDLLIHRGAEYTNEQIIAILQLFINSLAPKKPTNGTLPR